MFELTLLITALLFGGMTLYSFGFAAFLFTALPADSAGPLLRRAFPHFYLFVLGASALAGVAAGFVDLRITGVMAAIFVTTLYARQILMPAINDASDTGAKQRFARLHGLSVGITLAHILAAAATLLLLSGAWPFY